MVIAMSDATQDAVVGFSVLAFSLACIAVTICVDCWLTKRRDEDD